MLIWGLFWVNEKYDLDLNRFGLYPGVWQGLSGLIATPLLHGDMGHLVGNSLPLLVLGTALNYFYRGPNRSVWIWSYVLPSLMIWFFARPAYHIGASGLIYALASFLFFSGIFRRNRNLLAVSLLVVFLYGGLTWGMFPFEEQISWEAHAAGAFTGLILSVIYRNQGPPLPAPWTWEEEEDPGPEDSGDQPNREEQTNGPGDAFWVSNHSLERPNNPL